MVLAIAFAVVPLPVVDVSASSDDKHRRGFGRWEPQGPSPATFGQVENVRNAPSDPDPTDEVTGAVHTVLAHPTAAGTLYIGTVNGGVWTTTNAKSTNVKWKRLTDDQASQSIGALDMDPVDRSHRTLVAGLGRFSSFSRIQGGALLGLLYTDDDGRSWTPLNGGGVLIDKNISGVAARRKTLVISVNTATPNDNANRGVFRSTDRGETFIRVSSEDMAFGLPAGVAFDLVGDPRRPDRLFVPITSATGGPNGIYRSDDTGASWTKVSDAAIDAQLATIVIPPTPPNTQPQILLPTNVELAVGRHNNVYVAIARSPGRLSSVFRSGDGGATWTAMSIPLTPGVAPGNVQQGIHPGAQSFIHMSIAADKVKPNIVYLAGDRQPDRFEEGGTMGQFPNTVGARNYAGRIFRGDASQPLASQWAHMTNCRPGAPAPQCANVPVAFMPTGGTGNNSSPHADSREMAMDASNELIEVDDGGVYRRTQPQSNLGDWFSLNGNLQVGEQHSLAYDSLSKVSLTGNQDTGTPVQLTEDGLTWESLLTADGGDVLADHFSTPGQSIRYSSFQFLQAFLRSFWNSSNEFLGFTIMMRTPLGGSPTLQPQFYTPIALNRVQGNRILIGAANGLYESTTRGDTVTRVDPSPAGVANGSGLDSLAYGAANNPDAIYMGAGTNVRVRLGPPPAAFASTNLNSTVVSVVMHPQDANIAFAATNVAVFMTTNGGGLWTDITNNLPTLNPLTLRSLEFVTSEAGNALVVGSLNGAYSATQSAGFANWAKLGKDLPTVPVYELQYSGVDDVLLAGTLGRGAFKLENASAVLTTGGGHND
jgi:photosystem II stability/assembly factor-like uncharacterized protein